jgi:hypothetical protein
MPAARWLLSGSAVHSRAIAPLVKAGAEGDQHDLVTDLDATRVDRLGEGNPTDAAEVLP